MAAVDVIERPVLNGSQVGRIGHDLAEPRIAINRDGCWRYGVATGTHIDPHALAPG